jgi:signal transduction histidine kinase
VHDDISLAGPRELNRLYLPLHAGLLAGFVGLAWLTDSAGLLLFGLCPLAYLTLPVRRADLFVVLYSLTPTATYLARTGDVNLALRMYLPLGLGAIVVSVFAARWFLRMRTLTREIATMQERERLAGEIHDTVAQGAVQRRHAAGGGAGGRRETAHRHIGLAMRTARENMHEARALVGALTPVPLDGHRRSPMRWAAWPPATAPGSPSRGRPARCPPAPRSCCFAWHRRR